MPEVTSTRSERVRAIRGLSRRSVREKTGRFLAEGPQPVREAVLHRPDHVLDLYLTGAAAARHVDIAGAAEAAGVRLHEVSEDVLAAMCDTPAPQGLAAVCRVLTGSLDAVLEARPRLLCVLTNVRDPGNAGTVVRAADAAGADAVLVAGDSVDVWGPKVVRSTAGSHFHLPVVTGLDVEETLTRLRDNGIRLFATDGAGTTLLTDVDLLPAHAWVTGNEAWGMSEQTRSWCDDVVRVPIYGAAESLNLAMAATVCLYASAVAQNRPSGR